MPDLLRDFLFWTLGAWVGFFVGRIWNAKKRRAEISRIQAEVRSMQAEVARRMAQEPETWRNP
jgi:hypothetical protein